MPKAPTPHWQEGKVAVLHLGSTLIGVGGVEVDVVAGVVEVFPFSNLLWVFSWENHNVVLYFLVKAQQIEWKLPVILRKLTLFGFSEIHYEMEWNGCLLAKLSTYLYGLKGVVRTLIQYTL